MFPWVDIWRKKMKKSIVRCLYKDFLDIVFKKTIQFLDPLQGSLKKLSKWVLGPLFQGKKVCPDRSPTFRDIVGGNSSVLNEPKNR